MDQNPLIDITEKLKQQRLAQQIQDIENDIAKLKGVQGVKMFEIEIFQQDSISKIMINPNQIEYVDDADGFAVLHMVSGAVLRATKPWSTIQDSAESPNIRHAYIK